jgi:hypothetical protein
MRAWCRDTPESSTKMAALGERPRMYTPRDSYYQFLKSESVPITEANHKAYGVASIPMHVLIDREGVVRLYRPGRMTEADLEASILDVLAR